MCHRRVYPQVIVVIVCQAYCERPSGKYDDEASAAFFVQYTSCKSQVVRCKWHDNDVTLLLVVEEGDDADAVRLGANGDLTRGGRFVVGASCHRKDHLQILKRLTQAGAAVA